MRYFWSDEELRSCDNATKVCNDFFMEWSKTKDIIICSVRAPDLVHVWNTDCLMIHCDSTEFMMGLHTPNALKNIVLHVVQ